MKNGMNEHAFKKVEREETNAIIDFWFKFKKIYDTNQQEHQANVLWVSSLCYFTKYTVRAPL